MFAVEESLSLSRVEGCFRKYIPVFLAGKIVYILEGANFYGRSGKKLIKGIYISTESVYFDYGDNGNRENYWKNSS